MLSTKIHLSVSLWRLLFPFQDFWTSFFLTLKLSFSWSLHGGFQGVLETLAEMSHLQGSLLWPLRPAHLSNQGNSLLQFTFYSSLLSILLMTSTFLYLWPTLRCKMYEHRDLVCLVHHCIPGAYHRARSMEETWWVLFPKCTAEQMGDWDKSTGVCVAHAGF